MVFLQVQYLILCYS